MQRIARPLQAPSCILQPHNLQEFASCLDALSPPSFSSPLLFCLPPPRSSPFLPTTPRPTFPLPHNASDAGVGILQAGGNAIDAAVAVAFALAVVYPQAGNLGGGGFMLIRSHTGHHGFHTHFLDYREKAPAAATRDMYLDAQGNVAAGRSTEGYLASGVPGTVAGLTYAQSHFGRLTLAQDMAPAIKLADSGYILSEGEASNLQNKTVTQFPESAHIFQRDGNFYQAGDRFEQPVLAETLRRIAAEPSDFYQGVLANTLSTEMQKHGGLITTADLAAYQVKDRAPVVGNYHGYKIFTAPPPSSGGIVLVEILNILSTYKLPKLGPAGWKTTDHSAPPEPPPHTAPPRRLTSSLRLSAAPTWIAPTTSATPTSPRSL